MPDGKVVRLPLDYFALPHGTHLVAETGTASINAEGVDAMRQSGIKLQFNALKS